MMNKVFAVLPCYNEEDNIEELIDKWENQRDKLLQSGYELIVAGIDDCSTDNTKSVISAKCKKYDNVILLEHEVNKNLCGGLNTAIEFFTANGSKDDLLVLMDGDNTHDPVYIHVMIQKLVTDNKDCVIASRYCENSAIIGVSGHRELMSDLARIYYTAVLRVPDVKDYTCGYRVYRYSAVQKLVAAFGTEPITEKSFACMMELLYKLYLTKATFGEIGFELRYDYKQGESKMNVLNTAKKSLITALKLKLLHTKEKRHD